MPTGKLIWDQSKLGGSGPGHTNSPRESVKTYEHKDMWLGQEGIGQIVSSQDHPRPALRIELGSTALTAILDTQASDSFISNRVVHMLPFVKSCQRTQVIGATSNVTYQILGQTVLKGKCSNLDLQIPVFVISDLIPDVILGHDFLSKYGVILDYTAHEIFMGKDNRKRIAWYNGNTTPENSNSTSDQITNQLQIGPVLPNQKARLLKVLTMRTAMLIVLWLVEQHYS